MIKLLVRLVAAALFIVFFAFALKNTDEVVLRLFWNAQAKSPLILLLLGFLLAGAVMGVLAMTSTVLRYRRELARCKAELEQHRKVAAEGRDALPANAEPLVEQVGL